MQDRSRAILNAIIREFIETAEPVGSKSIVLSYQFSISSATIRNEMAMLEEGGFLFQPHTSAGRVPTDSAYRLYVNTLDEEELIKAEKMAEKRLAEVTKAHRVSKAREKLYDCVSILAQATENASFATLPDNPRTYFLGFSNVLKTPEFSRDPVRASEVIEMLEETDNFVKTLRTLDIDREPRIFIGKENIIPQIQSCSLIVGKYKIDDFVGYMGILGPTRMQYPYNSAMLKKILELLE